MVVATLNQQDARWASKELGSGQGYTIGKYGCALTCLTFLSIWYGRQTDPEQLNIALVGAGGFASNGTTNDDGSVNLTLLKWGMLAAVYGEILLQKNISYPTQPADMNMIDAYLAHNQPVVVGVSFNHKPSDKLPSHYVVIYKKNDDGSYQCMDPWFGDTTSFNTRYAVNGMSVANAILQAVCYAGPAPTAVEEAPPVAHQQVAQTPTDIAQKQADDNYNLYLQEADLVKQKNDRIGELQQQVTDLQNANSKLTTEIASTKELNSSLTARISDMEKNDSAAIEDLQKQVEQLKEKDSIVQETAAYLNTQPTKHGILTSIDSLFSNLKNAMKNAKSNETKPVSGILAVFGFQEEVKPNE